MDRRTFLGTMTAATVLANKLTWAAETHKIDKVGIQLIHSYAIYRLPALPMGHSVEALKSDPVSRSGQPAQSRTD